MASTSSGPHFRRTAPGGIQVSDLRHGRAGGIGLERAAQSATVDRDPVSERIEQILQSAEYLCFDAADVMPATMASAFNRAVLEYLNDPSRLETVLDRLDEVRLSIDKKEWVDLPCS